MGQAKNFLNAPRISLGAHTNCCYRLRALTDVPCGRPGRRNSLNFTAIVCERVPTPVRPTRVPCGLSNDNAAESAKCVHNLDRTTVQTMAVSVSPVRLACRLHWIHDTLRHTPLYRFERFYAGSLVETH